MLRLLRGQSLFGPDFHKNIQIIIEKFGSKPKLKFEIFYAEKNEIMIIIRMKSQK